MKKYFLFLLFACSSLISFSQETVDASFQFQNIEKSYSLYIPSTYDASVPNSLMLALHPLNTNRWDGESWRDTLIVFAEENNLLLVAPDGGADGRIDDPIDTAFTTVLLDSMYNWYNVDFGNRFVMGFSWGGKTSYTYGLRRSDVFKGIMAIGAAVELSEIQSISNSVENQNVYVVHGSQDVTSVRYFPIIDHLESENVCLESLLMQNVGHTIDFPQRNQILTDALNWLKQDNCITSSVKDELEDNINLFPNPSPSEFYVEGLKSKHLLSVFNAQGQKISFIKEDNKVTLVPYSKGLHYVVLDTDNDRIIKPIMIIK